MRPKVLLSLAGLFAVVLYIALNYTPGHAQQTNQDSATTVRLHRVSAQGGAAIEVKGRIIGFSCAPNSTVNAECFVATTD
jgi:hypothetical protein